MCVENSKRTETLQLHLLQKNLDNVCINIITCALKECRLIDNRALPEEDHRYLAKHWLKKLTEPTSGRDIGSDIVVAHAVKVSLWSKLITP